jgi:hypothetical protein
MRKENAVFRRKKRSDSKAEAAAAAKKNGNESTNSILDQIPGEIGMHLQSPLSSKRDEQSSVDSKDN